MSEQITITCSVCEGQYTYTRINKKGGKRRCCDKCRYASRTLPVPICEQCGKACKKTSAGHRRSYRFCSQVCFGKSRRKYADGDVRLDPSGYEVHGTIQKNGVSRHLYAHRVAMESHLGRELVRGETVHHKNGNRRDNRIENLELWLHNQPAGQRIHDIVADAMINGVALEPPANTGVRWVKAGDRWYPSMAIALAETG